MVPKLTDQPLDNAVQLEEIKKVKVVADEKFANSANLLSFQSANLLSIKYCWPLVAWTSQPTIPLSKVKKQTAAAATLTAVKEKVKVKKRKGDVLEKNERKRMRFSADSAITYCWPILPWVAPATHETPPNTRGDDEDEGKAGIPIVQKCEQPATLLPHQGVPAAKALASFTFPIIPLPIHLILLKMSPLAKPARRTKPRSLMRKVGVVGLLKVEERMEGEGEMREEVNESGKVPLLRLTYCWPILPYTKPNFTETTFTSLAPARGEPEIITSTKSNLIHPQV